MSRARCFRSLRNSWLVVAVLCSAMLVACGDDDNENDDAESRPRILAVQNARTGQLMPSGDGYRLILEGIDPQTVWFTDRPLHRAGTEPTGDLIEELFDSQEGPPNAAMVWHEENGETTLVLELLSADYDEDQGTLIYEVTVLEQSDGALADFGTSATVPTEAIAGPPLFVDAILQDSVCELDIYHTTSFPQAFEITTVYDTGSESQSGGPSVIHAGQSSSWQWRSSGEYCSGAGSISYNSGLQAGETRVAQFGMATNPSPGFEVQDCLSEMSCVTVVISDPTAYHVALLICDSFVPDADCRKDAGF